MLLFGSVSVSESSAVARSFPTLDYATASSSDTFSIILPLYTSGIGKVLLFVSQKLRLLSFPVYKEEKFGKKPTLFIQIFKCTCDATVLSTQ